MRYLIIFLLIFGCVEKPPEPGIITPSENISIAAFNIQVFGQAKADKPEVMDILAKTIARYDIVAIEEIRDKDGTAVLELLDEVNEIGDYSITVGPRLGRTSSKEQYAFFYRKGISLISNHTFNDSNDLFHREPYIAEFLAGNRTLKIAVLHTDPDNATEEIIGFQDIAEEGMILMGDLNADCSYFDEGNSSLKKYDWLIGDNLDTTVKSTNCTYDRIISTGNFTVIESGVFRFDDEYEINQSLAEGVSDHYPVYAIILNKH